MKSPVQVTKNYNAFVLFYKILINFTKQELNKLVDGIQHMCVELCCVQTY